MTRTTIPYWKLRRFAARCLAVLDRQADREPVMAAYEQTLRRTAQRWIQLYDASLAHRGTQTQRHRNGKESIASLLRKLHGWVPVLAASIDSLDPAHYGNRPDVPDDIISDTEQLITYVTRWEEATGKPLPYSQTMRDDLEQALDQARADWQSASGAASDRSGLTKLLRQASLAFNRDLVAFRRTLSTHLGRSHADYQKLRVSKAQVMDVDDDEVEDDTGERPLTPLATSPVLANPVDEMSDAVAH